MNIFLYLIAIIPFLIILFFFSTLIWSYIQYRNVQSPSDVFNNNVFYQYLNNKISYFEDIAISAGFIIIFILIAIMIAVYKMMFRLS